MHKTEFKKKPKVSLYLTFNTGQMVCGKHYDMSVAQNRLLVSLENVASQANCCQQIWVESLRTMATNFLRLHFVLIPCTGEQVKWGTKLNFETRAVASNLHVVLCMKRYETNGVQLSERPELLHQFIDWLTMHALHSGFTQLKLEFPFMLPKQCQQSTQPMDISHYVGLHRKLLELFRVT